MAIQFNLRPDQLYDLSVIRDLGPETIQLIIKSLSNPDPLPIRPGDIEDILEPIFKGKEERFNIFLKSLMSLYTLRRQRGISAQDLIEGLNYGIIGAKDPWSEELIGLWKSLGPLLIELFSLSSVWTVVKSLDLSYDQENLLQNIKILTDIRPIYSDDATKIQGSIVSFTMRLYYDSMDSSKSLSISLDKEDIVKLHKACERAILKSATAVTFLTASDIKSILVCGEEE